MKGMVRDLNWLRYLLLALVGMSMVSVLGRPVVGKIVVSKSAQTMTVYDEVGGILREFIVILGVSSAGPKQREGDGKTPEGEYFVCFKNPQSRFHLSLGLSYPNVTDAHQGLQKGLISEEEYRLIVEANRQKKIPPWKTTLGGEIFIHGKKDGRGATAGCIAISDHEIEEIFPLVEIGTPVIIHP